MKKYLAAILAVLLVLSCMPWASAAVKCNHSWVLGAGPEDHPAGCESAGVQTMVCTQCGAAEPVSVGPTGHYWSDWEVVQTESGPLEQCVCLNCGHPNVRQPQTEPEAETEPEAGAEPANEEIPFGAGFGGIHPELVLTVVQTSPAQASYLSGETIVFDWYVTNIGDEDCTLSTLEGVFACNPGSYTRVCDVVLQANGGMVGGSGSFQLPSNPSADLFSDYITFRAYGIGTVDGFGFSSNSRTLDFNIRTPGLDEWVPGPDPAVLPDESAPLMPTTDQMPYTPDGGAPATAQAAMSVWVTCTNTAEAPKGFPVGYAAHFVVRVGNVGNVGLTDIVLTDTLSQGPLVVGASLAPGESRSFEYDYIITPANALNGSVTDIAVANAVNFETGEPLTATDSMVIGASAQEKSSRLLADLTILNPRFYLEGESIAYRVTICNDSDTALELTYAYAEPCGQVMNSWVTMEPHGLYSWDDSYTVTAADVANGYIDFWAYGLAQDDAGTYAAVSQTERVYTGILVTNMSIQKKEISTPQDGTYYIAGEKVLYEITVENCTGDTVTDVEVIDPLAGYRYIGTMLPGESTQFVLSYEITDYDCQAASVINTAICQFVRSSGVKSSVISNPVEVRTYPLIHQVRIQQYEASSPANGSFYTLNETIDFEIVIYNGTAFDNILMRVKDSVNSVPAVPVGETYLDSGCHASFTVSHTVTEEDVTRGYVDSVGVVICEFGAKASNTVAVPTNGTFGGTMTVASVPGAFTGSLPAGPLSDEPCSMALTQMGSQTIAYELHFCRTHLACSQTAAALNDPEQVVSAWEEAINGLYTVCVESGTGNAAALVDIEQEMFWSMIDARIAMLRALKVEEAQIARDIDLVLTEYCSELCCTVNTAPDPRADSYMGTHAAGDTVSAAVCSDTITERTDSGLRITRQICDDHAVTEGAAQSLLATGSAREAASVMRIRQVDLDQTTRAVYREAEAGARDLITEDRLVFGGWLKNHIDFLRLFYGEDSALPYELTAHSILARSAALESMKK